MSKPRNPQPPVDHEQPPVMDMVPRKTVRHIPLAPHQYTERITPSTDVFVLAHMGIPRARAEDWWLDVAGLVDKPLRLSFDEITRMPKRRVTALHECAGFPKAPHIATRRYANVTWGGVDLASVLQAAGIQAGARYLWSYGLDRGAFEDVQSHVYLKDMPLDRLTNGDVLLAYELNGERLDSEHGFPLRLIIPGFYGTNSVKWLYRLELSDRRPEGPFTTTYYNDVVVTPTPDNPKGITKPVWEIAPESIIVSPAANAELPGGTCLIWGWAWADAGIQGVEVSMDGGQNWTAANMEIAVNRAWQRFELMWKPPAHGQYTLMSRATDHTGKIQPLLHARNCVYEVLVTVLKKT